MLCIVKRRVGRRAARMIPQLFRLSTKIQKEGNPKNFFECNGKSMLGGVAGAFPISRRPLVPSLSSPGSSSTASSSSSSSSRTGAFVAPWRSPTLQKRQHQRQVDDRRLSGGRHRKTGKPLVNNTTAPLSPTTPSLRPFFVFHASLLVSPHFTGLNRKCSYLNGSQKDYWKRHFFIFKRVYSSARKDRDVIESYDGLPSVYRLVQRSFLVVFIDLEITHWNEFNRIYWLRSFFQMSSGCFRMFTVYWTWLVLLILSLKSSFILLNFGCNLIFCFFWLSFEFYLTGINWSHLIKLSLTVVSIHLKLVYG